MVARYFLSTVVSMCVRCASASESSDREPSSAVPVPTPWRSWPAAPRPAHHVPRRRRRRRSCRSPRPVRTVTALQLPPDRRQVGFLTVRERWSAASINTAGPHVECGACCSRHSVPIVQRVSDWPLRLVDATNSRARERRYETDVTGCDSFPPLLTRARMFSASLSASSR